MAQPLGKVWAPFISPAKPQESGYQPSGFQLSHIEKYIKIRLIHLITSIHLEYLPGNHLVGGYGPPPGEGVGTLH